MSPHTAPRHFRFRMYVAGHTVNSTQAIANLTAICRQHLAERFEIEVVDVFKNPERALVDRIMMTPTLLRMEPAPVVRIVGSLSATDVVLEALEIPLNGILY